MPTACPPYTTANRDLLILWSQADSFLNICLPIVRSCMQGQLESWMVNSQVTARLKLLTPGKLIPNRSQGTWACPCIHSGGEVRPNCTAILCVGYFCDCHKSAPGQQCEVRAIQTWSKACTQGLDPKEERAVSNPSKGPCLNEVWAVAKLCITITKWSKGHARMKEHLIFPT